MTKFYTPPDDGTGWTDWQMPTRRYKMACCDCGLVHDMEFAVMVQLRTAKRGYLVGKELPYGKNRAAFLVRRNVRSTSAMRRHKANGDTR